MADKSTPIPRSGTLTAVTGAVVVVGTHWGDEAKGKFVDVIGQDADVVIRYGGGPNAGHTVMVGDATHKFHLIPSGILNPKAVCVMADGMVIAPEVLAHEIATLREAGVSCDNLRVSQNAHVILPYHKRLDELEEAAKGAGAIGTTGRGVGPCYADKASRIGIRMGDLLDETRLRERLAVVLPLKNRLLLKVYKDYAFTPDVIVADLRPVIEQLRPFICDTQAVGYDAVENSKRILFEGAQATLLDIDGGTYPFVTSSHPVSGGATIGTGVPPTAIGQVLGVVKAYTTRVGAGTFPTELTDERGDRIRERGHEYGTTTGRPRRCGWLDAFALGYSVRVNGLTGFCMGHLDVLAGFDAVSICTHYTRNGEKLAHFPVGDVSLLTGCEPVFETLLGWAEVEWDKITHFEDLPTNAQAYVRRVEQIAGIPALMVSFGARRDQTLIVTGRGAPRDLFTLPRPNPFGASKTGTFVATPVSVL